MSFQEQIIKTFFDGSFLLNCAFCEGSGIFPETPISDDSIFETAPCPVCEGKGVTLIKAYQEDVLTCRYCGGNGRAWDEMGLFVGEQCPICKGRGVIALELSNEHSDTTRESLWSLLHPEIASVAKERFASGHYADAVEAALKEVNTKVKLAVKKRIGKELDGVAAIECALSLDKPILRMADLSTESGRNIQKGYLQIFSGAIIGIRNPKAHENIVIDDHQAIHLLFVASLLMSKIDEAKQYQPT